MRARGSARPGEERSPIRLLMRRSFQTFKPVEYLLAGLAYAHMQ